MFQSLRQGSTIYVLDKTSGVPVLKTGEVINVGAPTPIFNTPNTGIGLGFQPKYEIAIRARVDGKEGDFSHLPADQSSHNYGALIVTDTREAMLNEVNLVNNEAQQRIDNRPNDEATVKACSEIFKDLNPAYAKEQERDEAMSQLSNRLDGIEDAVTKILNALK
jgi:hypothetical protein